MLKDIFSTLQALVKKVGELTAAIKELKGSDDVG